MRDIGEPHTLYKGQPSRYRDRPCGIVDPNSTKAVTQQSTNPSEYIVPKGPKGHNCLGVCCCPERPGGI